MRQQIIRSVLSILMLVMFSSIACAQTAAPAYGMPVGIDNAKKVAAAAAMFKRPTKAFQDIVAQGGVGLRILGLEGAVPVDGGIPIIEGGRIIGAIGASGGTSEQDGQCAQAGVNVLK